MGREQVRKACVRIIDGYSHGMTGSEWNEFVRLHAYAIAVDYLCLTAQIRMEGEMAATPNDGGKSDGTE